MVLFLCQKVLFWIVRFFWQNMEFWNSVRSWKKQRDLRTLFCMLGHEKRTKGLLLVPRADLSPKGDFYKENKTAALLKNYCEKIFLLIFCSHIQMTENVPQARKEWNKRGQKSLLHLFLKQDWNFMRYSRSRKKCWKCEVMQKYWDSTATNATQSRKITRKKTFAS